MLQEEAFKSNKFVSIFSWYANNLQTGTSRSGKIQRQTKATLWQLKRLPQTAVAVASNVRYVSEVPGPLPPGRVILLI